MSQWVSLKEALEENLSVAELKSSLALMHFQNPPRQAISSVPLFVAEGHPRYKHLPSRVSSGLLTVISVVAPCCKTCLVYHITSLLETDLNLAFKHGMQTGTTMADQIDLLREQIKMLAGEVAFCSSSLKRLIEQAANNPDDLQIQVSFPLSCNT